MNYDYKINITEKNNAHTQCINLIAPNSKVLDIGCAVGALGEHLNQIKKCEVTGVDFIDEFINICKAKNCYKNLFKIDMNASIEKLERYKNYFDYILLADIIEHLYNPKEVLEKLKPLLNENGSFILSIPNVAHASTKLNLLKNNFEYTEEGLLDKTHIRFFTRTSIIDLVKELNLNIVNDNLVLAPFSTYYEKIDLCLYPNSILNMLSSSYESFVYQYILEVKRNPEKNCDLMPNNEHIKKINKMRTKVKMTQLKKLFRFKF